MTQPSPAGRSLPLRSSFSGAPFRGAMGAWMVGALVMSGCAQPPAAVTTGDEAPEGFVGQSRLRDIFYQDGDFLVSPVLVAPSSASRVAVWLTTPVHAMDSALPLQARGFDIDGVPTAWLPLDERWREGVQRVGRVELPGLMTAVEVRLPMADADKLEGLVYSAVIPPAPAKGDTSGEQPIHAPAQTSQQALSIDGVEPRANWQAREPNGCDPNPVKDWITVHHSVTALAPAGSRDDHAAAMRGLQAMHMDGRGWCDIGYHFAVSADGTAWEAREAELLGTHTANRNTNNAGVLFIGCFHPSVDCNGLGGLSPTEAQMEAGGALIGRIAAHYGIPLNADTVIGHRDNPNNATDCPGDGLHDKLGELISIASAAPDPNVEPTGKVQGMVWDLSITPDAAQAGQLNARLPGTTIELSDGATTVARDDDAYWSFTVAPGTYTITASRSGYAPASRVVQVAAGADVWASLGIAPEGASHALTVRVLDGLTNAAVANASVAVTGADAVQTDAAGIARFALAAGDVTVQVAAEGYESETLTATLTPGASSALEVALNAVGVEAGGDDKPDDEEDTVNRVTILPPTAGGCHGAGGTTASGGLVLLLAVLFAIANRRRMKRVPAR